MQSNRYPDIFAFDKCPTENNTQYRYNHKIQIHKRRNKFSTYYPNRKMNKHKHNGIDNNDMLGA